MPSLTQSVRCALGFRRTKVLGAFLAELAFSFDLTLPIIIKVLLFSLLMGFLGGFLPAFRAAKLNIVSALRSA